MGTVQRRRLGGHGVRFGLCEVARSLAEAAAWRLGLAAPWREVSARERAQGLLMARGLVASARAERLVRQAAGVGFWGYVVRSFHVEYRRRRA